MSSLGVVPPHQPRRVPSGRRSAIVPEVAPGPGPGGSPVPYASGRLTSGQRVARRHAEVGTAPRPVRGRVSTGRRLPVASTPEPHDVAPLPRRPGTPSDRRPAYAPLPAYLHRPRRAR